MKNSFARWFLITIIASVLSCLLFCSCRTVRSTQHKESDHKETVATDHIVNQTNETEREISIVNETGGTIRTIDINIPKDTCDEGDTNYRSDYPPTADDYDSAGKGHKQPAVIIKKDGTVIVNRGKVSVKEKANTTRSDTTVKETARNTLEKKDQETKTIDDHKVVDTTKKKTGITFFGTITLLSLTAIILLMLWIAWKEKKRRQVIDQITPK